MNILCNISILLCLALLSHNFDLKIEETKLEKVIKIEINGQNLSEDMNMFSSMDDEIIFQIYQLEDSSVLNNPIVSETLLFDEKNRIHKVELVATKLNQEKRYLLLLIEYDTDKPAEQRNPIWRIYHQEINDLYQSGDRLAIGKYIGNDDLLGLKQLTGSTMLSGTTIEFKGFHNMDKYLYEISIN